MRQLTAHRQSLGYILCASTALVTVGAATADPIPMRPTKPRAQPNPCAKTQRGINPNGPDFTGTTLRQNPNCPPLPQLLHARLATGVTVDGKTVIKDFEYSGGEIKSSSNQTAQLQGAMLLGVAENLENQAVRLRIDAVVTAPDPDPKTPANENADVRMYRIMAQLGNGSDPTDAQFHPNKPPTGEWAPLCPGGGLAVAVPGAWDYRVGGEGAGAKNNQDKHVVTFACDSAAIAKCVIMGYKPWKSASDGKGGPAASLDTLHQACVRAVRADYCGDGETMTQLGMPVNFYDRAGVQRDTTEWPLEAVWSPEGALCVNSTRLSNAPLNVRTERPAMPVIKYIKEHCAARLSDTPCDQAALAAKGGILWTEVQHPSTTPVTTPSAPLQKTRN